MVQCEGRLCQAGVSVKGAALAAQKQNLRESGEWQRNKRGEGRQLQSEGAEQSPYSPPKHLFPSPDPY